MITSILLAAALTADFSTETGKICVIGSKLDEDKLAELFRK